MAVKLTSIVPSKKQRSFLLESVHRYSAQLATCSTGSDYLEARGLTAEMMERWHLGYVDDPINEEHNLYRGRIAIPYYTQAGYSSMVFRCTHLPGEECKDLDYHQKYLALPGYRPMFNVLALDRGYDTVYIVEGELDAIVATASGLPTVALGTALRWEPHWTYAFDGPRNLVGLMDGDQAGERMLNGWTDERTKEHRPGLKDRLSHDVTGVVFPPGYDVASYHKEFGADELVAYVNKQGE